MSDLIWDFYLNHELWASVGYLPLALAVFGNVLAVLSPQGPHIVSATLWPKICDFREQPQYNIALPNITFRS